mgnify:CR=1 FL=1
MSQEMRSTLQSILNSISNPAYIEQNGIIILHNDQFSQLDLDHEDILTEAQKQSLYIKEKNIHNNMKICELVENDLIKLEISKQKLTKAMALL